MPSADPTFPDRTTTDVVGDRILAQIVDLVVMFLQVVALSLALVVVVRPESAAGVDGLTMLTFLTLPLYGTVLEGYWHGQTVGKRLAGITVVDGQGHEPTPGQALLRNVPAVIMFSWVTVAAALAKMAMNDRRQRFFDEAAGTYVVEASRPGTTTRSGLY